MRTFLSVPFPKFGTNGRSLWAVTGSFWSAALGGAQPGAGHRTGTQGGRTGWATGWEAEDRSEGGRHTHRHLGARAGTKARLQAEYKATSRSRAGSGAAGVAASTQIPWWPRVTGGGKEAGGHVEGVTGRQIFHSPRESWCHEPLWFCKLGGETSREESKVIHPQSPTWRIREKLAPPAAPQGTG